ncbi:MAG: hypothetical protein AABY06_03600 [Nanoarchaeota archaeon]
MTNENLTNKLEEICEENVVGARINGSFISVPQPQSMREAEQVAYFWSHVFRKEKEYLEKIGFVYQKKDEELPLSYPAKLIKKLGVKIKPKIKAGEIGSAYFTPELIRYSSGKSVNFILKKDEWQPLNKIYQNCNTFSAPVVMLPENLCYQVNIPLECIGGVKFKEKIK